MKKKMEVTWMKLKSLKAKVCDMRYNWNQCHFRIGSLMCTWLFQCVCFKRVNFVPKVISVWPRERNISIPIDTGVPFQDYSYLYIFTYMYFCIYLCKCGRNESFPNSSATLILRPKAYKAWMGGVSPRCGIKQILKD